MFSPLWTPQDPFTATHSTFCHFFYRKQSLPLPCSAARALLGHQPLHLEPVNRPYSELFELISPLSLVRALLRCSPPFPSKGS
ncbi:hypothetical protein DEO72_LG2g2624 [Vigna unguiculata]|uniref:Uncharacterized protein n=1 Tax=Vigna unguiculata TaxID=3917 RepID=A0A4D6L1C5_VIGUN|nr:hypothetical protein DEO72_LG2g2624 [Vigna unguiculata]